MFKSKHMAKGLALLLSFIILLTGVMTGCTGNEEPKTPGNNEGPADNGDPGVQEETSVISDEEEAKRIAALTINAATEGYNIYDFGIEKGKDCSAAINAALSYVDSQGGGVIYFPAGNYNVTGTITIPSSLQNPIYFIGDNSTQTPTKFVYRVRIQGDVDPYTLFGCFDVQANNFGMGFIQIESQAKAGPAIQIRGNGNTLYKCTLRSTNTSNQDAVIRVAGSNGLYLHCGVSPANQQAKSINVTKLQGVECKNNKIGDIHFGGLHDSMVIDSLDPNGCPENVHVTRMVFLNYGGGQFDVKSVKNCVLDNSMLDQGFSHCIKIEPTGVGIDGLTIQENYISSCYQWDGDATTNIGITFPAVEGNAPASNIRIINNMIVYNKHGIFLENTNISGLEIRGNDIEGKISAIEAKVIKDITFKSNFVHDEFYVEEFSGNNVIKNNIIRVLSPLTDFDAYEKDNKIGG